MSINHALQGTPFLPYKKNLYCPQCKIAQVSQILWRKIFPQIAIKVNQTHLYNYRIHTPRCFGIYFIRAGSSVYALDASEKVRSCTFLVPVPVKDIHLEEYNNETANRYVEAGIPRVNSPLTTPYTRVFQRNIQGTTDATERQM